MGRTRASDWFSKFKSSVTSVEDARHLVHLSPSKKRCDMGGMKELVLKNSKISV
jgi:hypothetical protein